MFKKNNKAQSKKQTNFKKVELLKNPVKINFKKITNLFKYFQPLSNILVKIYDYSTQR